MLSWLGGIFKDPDKRAVISWLGGGVGAVVVAIWAVFTFVVEHKDAHDKDGRQTGQAVAEAQRPLLDRNEKLAGENAKLTLQLEQARKGPQTPGSQQAVAEAVDATAKDAAAGNSRAKQALELLNAGKIAEAVPLFQAEAAEKEAASRGSAKEAAAAYRNLGAIARPRRPEAGAGGL